MIEVRVTGIEQVSNYLQALAKGELSFGVAKGLTDLAGAARDEVIFDLPNKFTLRKPWFMPGNAMGFNISKATKDRHVASIYTRAPWMRLQESGGIKRAAGRIAMPTRGEGGIRRTKRDLVPANLKPHALGDKAFKVTTHKGLLMLARRVGRGRASRLEFLYILKQQAQITPRLHFHDTVKKFVSQRGLDYIKRGIDYALRSAK